jgi:hypothetical protein
MHIFSKKKGPFHGLHKAKWPIRGSDGGDGRAAMSLLARLLRRGFRGTISLRENKNECKSRQRTRTTKKAYFTMNVVSNATAQV